MRSTLQKTRLPLGLLAAAFGALPGHAVADHRPAPFDVVATISKCKGDSLTIAAEIKPSTDARSARARKAALRRVRGAKLKVSFDAVPLHGATVTSDEVDLGKVSSGRRFERFLDLRAQTYTGVVRYRWVRGKRTVLKGFARSKKGRAAGQRGRAFCSLAVGKPPADTQAPFVFPIPYDNAWKRGPLTVFIYASDDLSGVSGVFYRLDRGQYRSGRSLRITTEGSHQLDYVARDAAGNQTPVGTVTLRVDTSAPTAPGIVGPAGPTADTTPDISWTPSTDSGSGVRGYYVLVRNSSDTIVFGRPVTAGVNSVTVPDALAPGQYTAQVIAFDGAGTNPFTTTSATSFSVV